MGDPIGGLREGDPRQLGGYRLVGRMRDSMLGVVFLGRDGSGERASVAVLSSGAGADPQARERFVEVVRGREDVLAARTHGRSALWVAVPFHEDGPGAEEVLEETAKGGRVAPRGPVVMPHWAGAGGGVVARWAPWSGRRDSAVAAGEGNWWLIGALGAFLLLLLLLFTVLYVWMLSFPPPEMPSLGQPVQIEQDESPSEEEPEQGEEESPTSGEGPDVPAPTPGDGEWGDLPEDNL